MPEQDDDRPEAGQRAAVEDPVYLHSLREAKIVICLWAVAMVYTCSYCYLFGYESHPVDASAVGPAIGSWFGPLESFDRDPSTLATPLGLGIPDWVFYGIVLPWIACVVVTFWFCLFVFREDDLGGEEETSRGTGESVDDGDAAHG